jgi:uncharacterized membrane protein (UPF0127 family)
MDPMRIINQSNGKVIAGKVMIANTFFKRLKGLLTSNGLEENEGLIIKPCNSVHSFGMRFSIDLVFLSLNNEVIKITENFAPWRASPVVIRANSVIELPTGKIKETGIKVGDKIIIQIGDTNIL